jgi:adenylate kinase
MSSNSAQSPLSGKLLFPFVAPPNAGKGTQTQILSQRYPLPTFDMGATFRAILKDGADPEAKAELENYMNQGRLVPVRTVAKVFQQHFESLAARHPEARGFILDGFPRNAEQAEVFEELCKTWNAQLATVIYLHVSTDTVEKRATGRRFCSSNAQHLYNINNAALAPQQKKVLPDGTVACDAKGREIWLCDHDQAELIIRPDDEPEKVQIRLKEYAKETEPLLDYFRKEGVLTEIDGERSPEEVTRTIDVHLQTLPGLSRVQSGV